MNSLRITRKAIEMNKKVVLEIEGKEVVTYVRTVVAEVPDDMPDEEIECINADHFSRVEERTDWEVNDSEGVCAEGFPTVVGDAPDEAEPDLFVVRDEHGEYRIQHNEKFLLY